MKYGITVDVMRDMQQRALTEKEQDSLEGRVKELENMLVERFGENCNTCLYTLKHYLVEHIPEEVGRVKMLYVLDIIPYEHFNVCIRLSYKRTS